MIYAVSIGDSNTTPNPFNEAIFKCANKTEARKSAQTYIRQWSLQGERVLQIRELTEQEHNQRAHR